MLKGFLPLDVVTALFVCLSKTAVCGAARRARADFFGFLCPRWARTQSAAARPRADAAMMAHSCQLFLGPKTAFLFRRLEPPNLGRCAMPRHQLPAPRRGRLPRPPWRPARGRLVYRDRRDTGRNHFFRENEKKMNPTQRNRRGGARRAWRIRLINAVCLTKAERSSGQNNAVLRNRSAAAGDPSRRGRGRQVL